MKKWVKILLGVIFILKGIWAITTKEFYGKGFIHDLYSSEAPILGIMDCIIGLVFIYFATKTPKGEVNKKQLIVLGMAGLLICGIFFFVPKKYVCCGGGKEMPLSVGGVYPVLRWETIIPSSLAVLMVSFLLYLILKDRKNSIK
jgi:hypothetical protein